MRLKFFLLLVIFAGCSSYSNKKIRNVASEKKSFTMSSELFLIETPVDFCSLAKIKETFYIGQNQQIFEYDTVKRRVIPAAETQERILEFYAVILDDGNFSSQKINPTKSLERAKQTLNILIKKGFCNHPQVYQNNDHTEYEIMLRELAN